MNQPHSDDDDTHRLVDDTQNERHNKWAIQIPGIPYIN